MAEGGGGERAYHKSRKKMKQMGSMSDQMATVAVWIRRWRGTCSGAKLFGISILDIFI